MKTIINTNEAPKAIGPYSQATSFSVTPDTKLIYTSGQLPINPITNKIPETIVEQTHQSLKNVKSILESAGFNLQDVIKTTVYLSNIGDFQAMNQVYQEYFTMNYPARSAFEVSKLPLNVLVEIEVVACKNGN